jgi:hypothetical protein
LKPAPHARQQHFARRRSTRPFAQRNIGGMHPLRHLPKSPQRAFFGSWVVRATFVMAVFGWGVGFYGPSIFLPAVVQRTGWSLTLVSMAVTVHSGRRAVRG